MRHFIYFRSQFDFKNKNCQANKYLLKKNLKRQIVTYSVIILFSSKYDIIPTVDIASMFCKMHSIIKLCLKKYDRSLLICLNKIIVSK